MSTKLFHPNLAGVTRVREDEAEIAEHKKAGWVTEDPAEAAAETAAAEAETDRRSEAAKKAAETRRKNAAKPSAPAQDSGAPVVTPVAGSTQ